ncbi:MAG: MBL fold metallo-hydrolase [Patescibacteria group bacterium]
MRISKHVHSCLLIEEENKTILIDPGIYTHEEKALDVNSLKKLDYLLITHEHQDHMHIPFIKELVKKFPRIEIISNASVKKILKEEGITISASNNRFIKIYNASHEKLPFGLPTPENSLFTVFDRLVHPGDSLSFAKTSKILALPIQAPWTSLTAAIEKAKALKPKVVIPIHDWHWKDTVRKNFYERAKVYLGKFNIDFKGLETKDSIYL